MLQLNSLSSSTWINKNVSCHPATLSSSQSKFKLILPLLLLVIMYVVRLCIIGEVNKGQLGLHLSNIIITKRFRWKNSTVMGHNICSYHQNYSSDSQRSWLELSNCETLSVQVSKQIKLYYYYGQKVKFRLGAHPSPNIPYFIYMLR